MNKINIDLETYSSVDLQKCGVYKYASSPDFEILLFGYSVDNGPVKVIDIAQGEKIPKEIIEALYDENIQKWSYNNNFERVCLSSYFEMPIGKYFNPSSWYCSLVWSAYMGLPLSLKGVGSVLKLDEQKMTEGKDLIRYFCCPCKPTETNGKRTRNYPHHAIDKWETFKAYNKRDVEVELSIQEKLQKFTVPDFVWDEYHIDQEINDRGVLVDLEFVSSAIEVDDIIRNKNTQELQKITGLENPNSVLQMKYWLSTQGIYTDSIDKKAILELKKDANDKLTRVLELRQQLAKSSVKKYQAMQNAACSDGRARGMFMFYGANRTGRFCLTGDHEVLTDSGWKRIDEWKGGNIACWNQKTEIISFQKAEQLVFPYEGIMYEYNDKRISQLSTPDHKMFVKKRYDGEWTIDTVENMSKYRPSIPFTGYRQVRPGLEQEKLRVMVMVQADAHYCGDGTIILGFTKSRKAERCKQLLRGAEIGFVYNEYNSENKTRFSFKIPSRNVPLWLREFKNKTFDTWLFDESSDVFFDEIQYWDGYRSAKNSIQYSTCNKQNADIVQAFAHISGRAASMRTKYREKEHSNWNTAYVVDIWLTPINCHEIRNKPTTSEFNGLVYCAQTTTGFFLVRRNQKVWVTGNSGRIIQLQNLPQNHLEDIKKSRETTFDKNFEALFKQTETIPNILSQLVRTAFIPKKGCKFIVSDFSAIEARVIAWLADEQWRIDTFRDGKDIYCASASQMFGVPVEKHGVNAHLRQKGKIAELACIAEGQLVLTDKGEIPIEQVTTDMKLWDGTEWVEHDGVIYKGEREVITYEGLTATPDHLVWCEGKQRLIQFGKAATDRSHLIQTGDGRRTIRLGENYITGKEMERKMETNSSKVRVYDIRNAGKYHRFTVSNHLVHNCGYGGSVGAMKAMGADDMGLSDDDIKRIVTDWRSSNPNITKLWWDVDKAAMKAVFERVPSTIHGIKFYYQSGMLFITLPSGRNLCYVKPHIGINQFGSECITYEGVGSTKKWERLETYGPKLVENIVQGIARDILCFAMKSLKDKNIVMHVHDELVIESAPEESLEDICSKMAITPPWADGLLLRADGYECEFYMKD